jgi:hypothetical protein
VEVKAGPSKGKMTICPEIFETRILRRIYGPVKENGMWR